MKKIDWRRKILVCICIFCCIVMKYDSVEANQINEEFAGGNGTENNPYQIANSTMFCNIRNHPDAHYVLIADIDLPKIDSNAYVDSFSGSLNGGEYTVTINETPLFNKIAKSAYVHNMKIVLSSNIIELENKDNYFPYFGTVAKWNEGTIERIESEGTVNKVKFEGSGMSCWAGGICGFNFGTIKYCHNNIDFYITNFEATTMSNVLGGISARMGDGAVISECWNSGELNMKLRERVNEPTPTGNCNGGIVGMSVGGNDISNCVNSGNILTNYTQLASSWNVESAVGFISSSEYIVHTFGKECEHSIVGKNCFIGTNTIVNIEISYSKTFSKTFCNSDVSYASKTLNEIEEWWDGLIKMLEDKEESNYSINAFSLEKNKTSTANKSIIIHSKLSFSKKMTSNEISAEVEKIQLKSSDPSILEITNCTMGLFGNDMQSTAFSFTAIAHRVGTVMITGTASNGMKAECNIVVTPIDIHECKIVLSKNDFQYDGQEKNRPYRYHMKALIC